MLDNIREWISDNLRYIILGVAILLLIIVVVFAIRVVRHQGSSSEKKSTTVESQTEKSTEAAVSSAAVSEETLTKDLNEVLSIVSSYWAAVNEQDYETLESLCGKAFDDTARAKVDAMDVAVEAYDNVTTYSKSGLTEGSYVVYVYMDLKLTGIATEAPTLREMYLQPDEEDNLIIVQSEDYTSEITAYTQERQTDSDVQALIKDVNNTLSERCEEDEDLKQYVESGTTTASSSEDEEETEGTTASTGAATVSASTGSNVRSTASTDGSILGSLIYGSEVTVVENLDNGWSKITYVDSSGSTVEGYMMTQYLSMK